MFLGDLRYFDAFVYNGETYIKLESPDSKFEDRFRCVTFDKEKTIILNRFVQVEKTYNPCRIEDIVPRIDVVDAGMFGSGTGVNLYRLDMYNDGYNETFFYATGNNSAIIHARKLAEGQSMWRLNFIQPNGGYAYQIHKFDAYGE